MQLMIWKKLNMQFKANTMSSLIIPRVDAVKEVGYSSIIGQILNPKKKQTQLEPSVFNESSNEEDDGKADVNQMLQREVANSEEGHQTGTAKEDKKPYSL